MKRLSRDEIKQKAIENMRNSGALNNLESFYISLVVNEIKDNNKFVVLKPYKIIKTEKPYLIAAQIVLQFLEKKSLKYSLSTLSSETEGQIAKKNPSLVQNSLNIFSDDLFITELMNDWNKIKNKIVPKNKENFRKLLQKRLDTAIPENEKIKPKVTIIQETERAQSQQKTPQKAQKKQDNKKKNVSSESSDSIEDIPLIDDTNDNISIKNTPKKSDSSIEEIQMDNKSSDFDDDIEIAESNSDIPDVSISSSKQGSISVSPTKSLTPSQTKKPVGSPTPITNDDDFDSDFDVPLDMDDGSPAKTAQKPPTNIQPFPKPQQTTQSPAKEETTQDLSDWDDVDLDMDDD